MLASYAIGHLLSFISSVLVEKYSEWVTGYPSKYLMGYPPEAYFSGNKFIRFMVAAFLAPVSITELFLNIVLNYRKTYAKSLDRLLIKIIKAKMQRLLEEKSGLTKLPGDAKAHNTDFFRFAYHFAVENASNHYPKMQNYVAIYGFLRTMTLISVAFFWGAIWHIFTDTFRLWEALLTLIAICLLSFTFYMAFVKFWRRFSLEALMAIAATFEVPKKVNPDSIA